MDYFGPIENWSLEEICHLINNLSLYELDIVIWICIARWTTIITVWVNIIIDENNSSMEKKYVHRLKLYVQF